MLPKEKIRRRYDFFRSSIEGGRASSIAFYGEASAIFQKLGLAELRKNLLYNNILDIWIALCEEKGWDWFDIDDYSKFVDYLRNERITLRDIPVCVEEVGKKAAFVKTFASKKGQIFKVQTMRTDEGTVEKLRAFQK